MITRAAIAVLLALLAAGTTRAADDEPEYLGRKLSVWLKDLHEGKTTRERRRGAFGLERIGHSRSNKVVPALVKAMTEEKDDQTRASLARSVGRAVAKAFADAREDGAEKLPRMDDARNALTRRLRTDKADVVREAAAVALGDIGPDARAAAGSLGAVLKDKSAGVVRAAAAALRGMKKDAKDAQVDLRNLLADARADPVARVDSAYTLGLIQGDVEATVPVLRALATDVKGPLALRKACVEALGKLGKEAAATSEALGKVLSEPKAPDELRRAVAAVLDSFGNDAKPAIPDLLKAVNGGDKLTRCLAMQSLGKMGKDLGTHRLATVKALLTASDDFHTAVRVSAVQALGAMAEEGYAGELPTVIKALDKISVKGESSEAEAAKAVLEKLRPKKK